jgi:DNA-binding transcriptional LysR family regulator
MNLHHLAVFHAIAESGSIRAAAASLHISEPAVSRQLRQLEARHGTTLFDRLPRGMRLTAEGEVLAGYARRIFALERQAETALAELRDLEAGHLAVGASTTIGNYLLPELLAAYSDAHPGVQVRLEVGNTEQIQAQLLQGELDVGLTEGFADSRDLRVQSFLSDELVVVAAPHFAEPGAVPGSLEGMAALPWVMREPGSGTRAVLERTLAEYGLEPRSVLALASTEAIKRAVAAGAGIAVVSGLTVASELERGELAELRMPPFPLCRPLHLLRARHGAPSRAAAVFLERLSQLGGPRSDEHPGL